MLPTLSQRTGSAASGASASTAQPIRSRRQQLYPVRVARIPPRSTITPPGWTPRIQAVSRVVSPRPEVTARSAATRRSRKGPASGGSADAADTAERASVAAVWRVGRLRSAIRTSPRSTAVAAAVIRSASDAVTQATRPRPPGPGPLLVVIPRAFTTSKTLARLSGRDSASSARRTPSAAASADSGGSVGHVGRRRPWWPTYRCGRRLWLVRLAAATATGGDGATPPSLAETDRSGGGGGVHREGRARAGPERHRPSVPERTLGGFPATVTSSTRPARQGSSLLSANAVTAVSQCHQYGITLRHVATGLRENPVHSMVHQFGVSTPGRVPRIRCRPQQ